MQKSVAQSNVAFVEYVQGKLRDEHKDKRCDKNQTQPQRVDVPILAHTYAHATQDASLAPAVQTTGNFGLGLGGGVGCTLTLGFGRAELCCDNVYFAQSHHLVVRLLREYQLGDASLDVGNDFGAIGVAVVGAVKLAGVSFECGVGILVKDERDASKTDVACLFHIVENVISDCE